MIQDRSAGASRSRDHDRALPWPTEGHRRENWAGGAAAGPSQSSRLASMPWRLVAHVPTADTEIHAMKRIRITHITRYHYRTPVSFGPHRALLRPREGHDLHIAGSRLEIEPAASVRWYRDISRPTDGSARALPGGVRDHAGIHEVRDGRHDPRRPPVRPAGALRPPHGRPEYRRRYP